MTEHSEKLDSSEVFDRAGDPLGGPDRYRMPKEESSILIRELLDKRPIDTTNSIVCYEIEGGSSISDCARTLEAEVFKRAFEEGPEEMSTFYGEYEDSSRFFVSINKETTEMVGVLRAIENSKKGLMTLNILSEDEQFAHLLDVQPDQVTLNGVFNQEVDLDSSWDIGTVGVPRKQREQYGKRISTQLYRAMYKSALSHDIDYLFSIIDVNPLATMKKYLGIPFQDMTGAFTIGGSKESIAVVGYVPDFYRKMRRKSLGLRGLMAASSLRPLVWGTKDDAISLLPCQK